MWAVHDGLSEAELSYNWQLYTVNDGRGVSPANQHTARNCVPADGSSYMSYRAGNATNNTTTNEVTISGTK